MKCLSLVVPCPRSRRQAPRALRERLECSEGGNTGRRTSGPTGFMQWKPAVRSAPGRDRAEARRYSGICRERQGKAAVQADLGRGCFGLIAPGVRSASLTARSAPSRDLPARSRHRGGWPCAARCSASSSRSRLSRQELLPKCRIGARARDIVFGNQVTHAATALTHCCDILARKGCRLLPRSRRQLDRPGSDGVFRPEFRPYFRDRRATWRSHSFFRVRAARPSAWARRWPTLLRRRALCSTKSMRRSARSSPRSCSKGPADTLTLTENAQPALMAVSLAAMRVLEAEAGRRSRSAMRSSSPAIRSANIRRLPPPAP